MKHHPCDDDDRNNVDDDDQQDDDSNNYNNKNDNVHEDDHCREIRRWNDTTRRPVHDEGGGGDNNDTHDDDDEYGGTTRMNDGMDPTVGGEVEHQQHLNRTRRDGGGGGRLGRSGSRIAHEALVRERTEDDVSAMASSTCMGFDDLYEVMEEIGRGGLCAVYKIRKYPDRVGMSARRSLLLLQETSSTSTLSSRRRTTSSNSSSSHLPNLLEAASSANPVPVPIPRPVSPAANQAHAQSTSEHGTEAGGSLSAPGTPTRAISGPQPTQPGGAGATRRRPRNVRSLSSPSPSSLDLRSPFWTRADGDTLFSSRHDTSQHNQYHHHRRGLDVKALRSAFKRGSHHNRGGGGTSSALGATSTVPEMLYAVKVFNLKLLTPSQARQLKNEVEALKTLDHPSIIKAYETFTCRESKQLMLVMELCTGGDLYARIPYREKDVSRVLYQVLSALVYMHDRNVVHRDLKLENIMFESTHPDAAVKLIDFGLAVRIGASSSSGTMLSSSMGGTTTTAASSGGGSTGGSSVLKERVGTLYCMAPCVLLGTGYTCMAGMWSVGVIAYTMLSGGTHPFHGKTPKQVVARILQCDYSFEGADESEKEAWQSVSDGAKSFIRALLQLEPSDRMSARQAIKHPWIQRPSMYSGLIEGGSDSQLFWPSERSELSAAVAAEDGDTSAAAAAAAATASAKTEEWKQRVTSEMVKYAEISDFRKLALNVIAKRSTSDEIFEIRQVFADMDTDNSGTLTLDDFRAALTQYDPTYSDEELEDIFRKIDVGGTSVINYTEFLASALEARGSIEEWRLADAFDLLDHDGSGCITKDDLRRVVGSRSADDSYLDELIAQAGGSTADGRISYAEFLRALSEQTHDMVYGMYEASRSRSINAGRYASDHTLSSAGTDSILERRGIAIPRLVSVTARQKLLAGRRRLASKAKSRLADIVQVLTPTTRDDVVTYISTGRPNPR